jgi:hypothetical protein
MHDSYHDTISKPSILAQVLTSAINGGTAVDTQGFDECRCVLAVGTQAGTSNTFKLQDSDTTTDGDFADVAAKYIVGAAGSTAGDPIVVTTANDEQVHERGYIGTKRYVRWNNSAASSGNLPASAHFDLSDKRHGPAH